MKIRKPLSKMSLGYLRRLKQEIISELEAGEPKSYMLYISDKQLGPREYAETDTLNKELVFSSRQTLNDVLDSFIHEYLHVILPNAKHKYIYRLTAAFVKELSSSDKERLFRALAIRGTWDE